MWYKFLQVDISVDYLENLGSTSTLKPQVYTLLVTSKLVGIRQKFRILILVRNSFGNKGYMIILLVLVRTLSVSGWHLTF